MAFPNPDTQFKPGVSGNPAGRPKGAYSWSTVVQNLLADEKLAEKMFEKDYRDYEGVLDRRDGGTLIALAMTKKAKMGDQKAAEWLRKTGFGDKVTHEFENSLFSTDKLKVKVVDGEDGSTGVDSNPEPEAEHS